MRFLFYIEINAAIQKIITYKIAETKIHLSDYFYLENAILQLTLIFVQIVIFCANIKFLLLTISPGSDIIFARYFL